MKCYFLKNKIIVIFLIVLLIFSLNLFKKEIKDFFYSLSNPFQSFFIEKGIETSSFLEGIKRGTDLKSENEDLLSQSQRIIGRINSLKNVEKENEELRKALDLKIRESFNVVDAYFSSTIGPENNILIDRGSEDGILKGMPIINSQKVLVGVVDEVYRNFSSVKLISSEDFSFNVEIVKKSSLEDYLDSNVRYQGLARGKGDSSLLVELVSKEAKIEKGDFVFTADAGQLFPKGLLVGDVIQVNKNDVDPFQTILINPSFNLSNERIVFVIIDY